MNLSDSTFNQRSHVALADKQIRQNFRRAMDGLTEKRQSQFEDEREWQQLRKLCGRIRKNALLQLPELLEVLERRCEGNGIRVHWATTTNEACNIVLGVVRQHRARRLIKGKSMVSEEMGLNDFMYEKDIECLESDLGEYIVQIAGEKPSHIIMPAIHKNTGQIADLFEDKLHMTRTEDVTTLTENARWLLRQKFMEADIGLSGVNFAVAETGTLCLVENEGNGRLSTTVPSVHVAMMGIEKVVEKLEHIPPLLSLLTRSATGQHITTYFNMITSPRGKYEKDGPQHVHLVLLDNVRSDMYQDVELRDTLSCIRCGACINHCPVYTRVGGHAYGAVYPGPIGKLLIPQMEGVSQAGDLPTACTLCGACGDICPVEIPIPDLIKRLRHESIRGEVVKGAGGHYEFVESCIWNIWAFIHVHASLYRFVTRVAGILRHFIPKRLGKWTLYRMMPQVASRTLHERLGE